MITALLINCIDKNILETFKNKIWKNALLWHKHNLEQCAYIQKLLSNDFGRALLKIVSSVLVCSFYGRQQSVVTRARRRSNSAKKGKVRDAR